METCENLPCSPCRGLGHHFIKRETVVPWAPLAVGLPLSSSSSIVWQKRKLPRAGALLPCGHAVGSLAVGW